MELIPEKANEAVAHKYYLIRRLDGSYITGKFGPWSTIRTRYFYYNGFRLLFRDDNSTIVYRIMESDNEICS